MVFHILYNSLPSAISIVSTLNTVNKSAQFTHHPQSFISFLWLWYCMSHYFTYWFYFKRNALFMISRLRP